VVNDLVVDNRKLAGLLCAASGDVALVGLGVNLLQQRFPDDFAMPAVSLLQASGRAVEPRTLLPLVLASLAGVAEDPSWRDALTGRLYARGQSVTVDVMGTDRSVRGVLETVDRQGRIVLGMPDGSTIAIENGEIKPGR
jgi:BirA family transcriptional regulator, biotin operon repressor / biotin---[acetyl-CoA-carboxylase] ligase